MLNKNHIYLISYIILFCIYALFSYSLTAPNLVLSSNQLFWKFQTFMWKNFFNNRELLSQSYIVIISLLIINYSILIFKFKEIFETIQKKKILFFLILLFIPLFLSNNALSYDVFNYIFNAKMVHIYQANPHISSAIKFSDDNWLRFMHNVHTPAPYGYGFTILSMIPYYLGFGKFILIWFNFRLFNIILIFLIMSIIYHYQKKITKQSLLLFLNPLFLIEIISNSHNDLYMMIPAIISFLLITNSRLKIKHILGSIILLFLSISIKLATLAILPIWLLLLLNKLSKLKKFKFLTEFLNQYWADTCAILMFLPLITARSQQFHPWYLTWVLIWIPFMKNKQLIKLIIIASFTSLYRYLPFLINNDYSTTILLHSKMITWSFIIIYPIVKLITNLLKND